MSEPLPPETANQIEALRRCDESMSGLLIRLVRQQQQRKTAGKLLARSK
jgi:hypothetical protein